MLKPCPFCGGAAVWQSYAGDYGYKSPTVWIACENEPFENPHGKRWDDRKHRCFAATTPVATEKWEPGKGTFSIEAEAKADVLAKWSARADGDADAAGYARATADIVALLRTEARDAGITGGIGAHGTRMMLNHIAGAIERGDFRKVEA